MYDRDDATNGRDQTAVDADRRILEAMEEAHDFPGYYPVVVIARSSDGFEADLQATLAAEQGGAPFRIRERSSREGNYVSYRVELFVATPEAALARKLTLASLSGVLLLL